MSMMTFIRPAILATVALASALSFSGQAHAQDLGDAASAGLKVYNFATNPLGGAANFAGTKTAEAHLPETSVSILDRIDKEILNVAASEMQNIIQEIELSDLSGAMQSVGKDAALSEAINALSVSNPAIGMPANTIKSFINGNNKTFEAYIRTIEAAGEAVDEHGLKRRIPGFASEDFKDIETGKDYKILVDAGSNIGNITPNNTIDVPFVIIDSIGKMIEDDVFERLSQNEGFQDLLHSVMFDAHYELINSDLGADPKAYIAAIDQLLEDEGLIDTMAREVARDILRSEGIYITPDQNDLPTQGIDASGQYQTIYSNIAKAPS